jgi:hypothetical protein
VYTGELIDRTLAHTENLDPSDADYVSRRVKHLEWAQDRYEEVWNLKPWKWKQKVTILSPLAGDNQIIVPDDFGNVSEIGGVYHSTTTELQEVQAQRIDRLKYLNRLAFRPTQFCVVGYDSGANQRSYVKFDAPGPFDVTMLYEMQCPLLSDRPTAPTLDAAGGGPLPAATYKYRVTYTTADGYESEPGDIASITTTGTTTITLVLPTSGAHNVAGRTIYRTAGDGGIFKFLATIGDDTTTAYTDTTLDASLQAAIIPLCTLLYIPRTYHFTVMLPGVIAKCRKVKGDTRDWEAEFQKGLAFMVNREIQRRSAVKRMPKAIPGRMW